MIFYQETRRDDIAIGERRRVPPKLLCKVLKFFIIVLGVYTVDLRINFNTLRGRLLLINISLTASAPRQTIID